MFSTVATSLKDVAFLSSASRDIEEKKSTHRYSYARVTWLIMLIALLGMRRRHRSSPCLQMPRNMAKNLPMSRRNSTTNTRLGASRKRAMIPLPACAVVGIRL